MAPTVENRRGGRRGKGVSTAWMALAALVAGGRGAEGFLPMIGPEMFDAGDKLPLFVNELTSTRTQAPMDHYQ